MTFGLDPIRMSLTPFLSSKNNIFFCRFEEVRQRYERRESRQEDINIISDLKQIISEQEKDLNCLNEEKRYFQMKLMALESRLENRASSEESLKDDPPFSDCNEVFAAETTNHSPNVICIPPTIEEGEE